MTASHTARPEGFRLTGWHVLAMIVAFFGTIIAVDGYFTYLALKTHPGEVSVTPYEDGLLYNRHIAQLKAQDALGWEAAAAAQKDAVVFEVRDRNGRPLRGLMVTGKLERPATETGRLVPRFRETAPGIYTAQLAGIRGAWDLSVETRNAKGEAFVAERRLTWR